MDGNDGECGSGGDPTPYVSIVLRRDDQAWIEGRKIAAIKGVRQMSLDLTGTTWGLKQAKDAVDCAENAPFVLFEEVPLAEASVACVKYNAEPDGLGCLSLTGLVPLPTRHTTRMEKRGRGNIF